jgi:hypothetical protein
MAVKAAESRHTASLKSAAGGDTILQGGVNGWRTQMAEMDSEAEVASTYKGD